MKTIRLLAVFAGVTLTILSSHAFAANDAPNVSTSGDKQSVIETIYQYSYRWDRKDAASLGQIFTEDAKWEWFLAGAKTPKVSLSGQDKISSFANERFNTNLADRQTRHFQTNVVFNDFSDTKASTTTMIMLIHKVNGKKQPKLIGTGVYHDEFVKTKDGWKIQVRRLVLD